MYSNSNSQNYGKDKKIKIRKKSFFSKFKRPGFEIGFILFTFLFSIPLYLILINTFKTHDKILRSPLALPDFSLGFANITEAFRRMEIIESYAVEFYISGTALVCMIIFYFVSAV